MPRRWPSFQPWIEFPGMTVIEKTRNRAVRMLEWDAQAETGLLRWS